MNPLVLAIGIACLLFLSTLLLYFQNKKRGVLLADSHLQLDEALEKSTEANHIKLALEEKYAPILNLDREKEIRQSEIDRLKNSFWQLNEKYQGALTVYSTLQQEIGLYEETLDINSNGLYQPKYSFDLPEQYLVELEGNYNRQKQMVKMHTAVICDAEWLVEGSKMEGRKMTQQGIKLMLFAFNGECDALISKVRWNNVTKARERMLKSYAEINKLGAVNRIRIVHEFLDLKLDELSLTYEYEKKKNEQKEEQRLIRVQMREEEKAQRDLQKVHEEAEEEAKLYQKILTKARQELGAASQEEAEKLSQRIKELEEKLQQANDKKERAMSLAQQTRVGNIYIISNIGSFGENIYKIGMTRRFDPMDRIKELSDAALPFQFDVHAIIHSADAPQLERDLHKKLWDRRINLVNNRKEFFNVSLEKIQEFVLAENAGIQFTKMAEAREYRETLAMIERLTDQPAHEPAQDKFPALMDTELD